jgi:hypothetical protein
MDLELRRENWVGDEDLELALEMPAEVLRVNEIDQRVV